MSDSGFWTGGPAEHRRAYEQHIADLEKRLEDCRPEDRAQIERDLENARKQRLDAESGRNLW